MSYTGGVGCDHGSESGRLRLALGELRRGRQASTARDETDIYLAPLMARSWRGHVFQRPWADGETMSYGTQVRAYGRYERVTFGTNKQGWNRTRAELGAERIAQQIERGTWVPPRLEPRRDRLEDAMTGLGLRVDETFRAFAARWRCSKQLDLAEKTFVDYGWRLGYLQRFLAATG